MTLTTKTMLLSASTPEIFSLIKLVFGKNAKIGKALNV